MAEIGIALALAGFGGFVRYIQKFTGKRDERPPWEWGIAGISIGTGSFVGILTFWIVAKKFDADYVHFAVAIAGYGGPLTLDAFWEAFRGAINRTASGAKDGDAKG